MSILIFKLGVYRIQNTPVCQNPPNTRNPCGGLEELDSQLLGMRLTVVLVTEFFLLTNICQRS